MADVKIADLPVADPLTGVEVVPIVQSILGNPTTAITTAQDISDFVTGSITLQTVLVNHNLVDGNNFQGTDAGLGNIGGQVIAFGDQAGFNNRGDSVVLIHTEAGYDNRGDDVYAVGFNAAYNNLGNSVVALGRSAALSNEGTQVVALGEGAATSNTGNHVNAFGANAANGNSYTHINAFGPNAQPEDNNRAVFMASNGGQASLDYGYLTDYRNYVFPNSNGTIALVNTSAFTGTKTIGGQVYTWTNGILISVV